MCRLSGVYPGMLQCIENRNSTKKNGILLELHTTALRDNPMPEREQGRARGQPLYGLAT